MTLTAENLVYYLLERGLLTAESVVDGDLAIIDASSRNRNYKVARQRGPGYFVKQVQHALPQAAPLLQREASCYWLAANDAGFAALAPLVPRFHLYDRAHHTLVVELLPDGENLSEHHRRLGRFPVTTGATLGGALGAYHRGVRQGHDNAQEHAFPREVPWILTIHQLAGWSPGQGGAAGGDQLLQIIRQHGEFHGLLDRLREGWRAEAFIHGDMKWDNCIVYGDDGAPSLKIVDWETADWGDPAWDVGAIFQAYLTFWIMTLPVGPGLALEGALASAPYPIEAMQPAIQAFWSAYREAAGLGQPAADAALVRGVTYGAARMLQTGYEYMFQAPQITANAVYQLQVALNILSSPREATRELLAL